MNFINKLNDMKKTIWKFPLEITDIQKVNMPDKAEILTVQMQNGIPCLWALVDPDEALFDEREIEIFGTGNHIVYDNNIVWHKYISTIQLNGGSLIFHVFERGFFVSTTMD